MYRVSVLLVAAAISVASTACVRVKKPALQPTAAVPGATLWERPTNLASRDLFYGPWGVEHAPDPAGVYTFVERKHTGVNPGMTVLDAQGREWSVKQPAPGGLDPEAPVEVVVSRLLSAVGYHQPPVYHLPSFTLKDDFGTHVELGGRFRLKDASLKDVGPWSWAENPFIATQPYKGLLVLLIMFNSTDMKDSNNTLYERKVGDLVEHWYAPRDVGSALGDTHRLAPRKGHPPSFARTPYILGVNNGFVDFHYQGWYRKLVEGRIKPDDVAWASNLLGQLSERQWQDAFRAGGYTPEVANQFIAKLKEKIAQGRTISGRTVADQ